VTSRSAGWRFTTRTRTPTRVLAARDDKPETGIRESILHLGATTDRGGLLVRIRLHRRRFEELSLERPKAEREEFHGEWNFVSR
jgi:hypothetical protein